jgi:hypothetical protein
MAMTTPANPTTSAAARCAPIRSPRKSAAMSAVISGAEKKIVLTSASPMNGKAA